MWYEVVPTARGHQYPLLGDLFQRGRRHADRSADGDLGPDDRHRVHLRRRGRRAAARSIAEEFQGPGHEVPAFKGQHEARHPLVWVSTDNNMVSESGPTRDPLRAARGGSISPTLARSGDGRAIRGSTRSPRSRCGARARSTTIPPPGHNTIADPRRFVYVEACGTSATPRSAVPRSAVACSSIDAGYRRRRRSRWTAPTAALRTTASSATAASGLRRRCPRARARPTSARFACRRYERPPAGGGPAAARIRAA